MRFDCHLKIVVLILCLSLLVAIIIPPVSAGLKVSGSKYMHTDPPGDVIRHKMIVSIRDSDSPMDLVVDVMGFGQSPDKGYIGLDPSEDKSPYSARELITVDKTSFHLEPGQSQDLYATIRLPDEGDGGRYALINIYNTPDAGGAMGIVMAINIPIMVTLAGTDMVETGRIADVSVGEVIIGQPVEITTSFENTGNHHYYHTVNEVNVVDAGGNTIFHHVSTPSSYAIIPGNTVNYVCNLDEKLPIGTYTVTSRVMLGDGIFLDKKSTQFTVEKPYVPPITEVSAVFSPGSAGTLTSPDGRYSVSIPAGALFADVELRLKQASHGSLPRAPEGDRLAPSCFMVEGLPGLLTKDATVTVKYSADDLEAAGGKVSMLKIAVWDAASRDWRILPTTVDAKASTITAPTNLLGTMAVVATGSTGTTATPVSACIPVLAVIICMICYAAVRKRK